MWDIYSKPSTTVGLVFNEVGWMLTQIHLWIWPLTELDLTEEPCVGETPVERREMTVFLRWAMKVKRERIRKQKRHPADAISFPTECCALQIGSVFPFIAVRSY